MKNYYFSNKNVVHIILYIISHEHIQVYTLQRVKNRVSTLQKSPCRYTTWSNNANACTEVIIIIIITVTLVHYTHYYYAMEIIWNYTSKWVFSGFPRPGGGGGGVCRAPHVWRHSACEKRLRQRHAAPAVIAISLLSYRHRRPLSSPRLLYVIVICHVALSCASCLVGEKKKKRTTTTCDGQTVFFRSLYFFLNFFFACAGGIRVHIFLRVHLACPTRPVFRDKITRETTWYIDIIICTPPSISECHTYATSRP